MKIILKSRLIVVFLVTFIPFTVISFITFFAVRVHISLISFYNIILWLFCSLVGLL